MTSAAAAPFAPHRLSAAPAPRATRHSPGEPAMSCSLTLRIDCIACTEQGLCAELLPELIDLDER